MCKEAFISSYSVSCLSVGQRFCSLNVENELSQVCRRTAYNTGGTVNPQRPGLGKTIDCALNRKYPLVQDPKIPQSSIEK